MTAKKELIKLLESHRKEDCLSTYPEDKVLDEFAGAHDLCRDDSEGEDQIHDKEKIIELVNDKYSYASFNDQFGHKHNMFTPASIGKLTKNDIKKALKELEDMSPKLASSSYPAQNVGAVTEWQCFIGEQSIFAKGCYQSWQGRWLVFIKGYGWCKDIKCTVSAEGAKSEIEAYIDMPEQIFIQYGPV